MADDNGLGVFLVGLPPRPAIDFAQRAEQRGFRSAWFPEVTFADAFGQAVAAATRTSRITLGTGIVGIWSRSPVTLALQAATLNELSDGRLLLGLGLQARGYVEGWHGARFEHPVTAMREAVTIVRRILTGEAVSYEGRVFSVRNFQLHMGPGRRDARIYMAANGPQMVQLAGELADGLIGSFHSVEYVRDVVMPNLELGAARAGRSLADFDITVDLPSLVTADDSGLELVKGQVVMFATALGSAPAYADSIVAAGFGDQMHEIQQRFARGEMSAALAAVPDEMADALTLAGRPEHVRERLARYRDAGLTSVQLKPSPPGGWFPLYEGHFPDGVVPPPFDFPAFTAEIEFTLDALAR